MKRIIVVGKNRSGTKWISNIISNHPDVFSIQSHGGQGTMETNIISRMPAIFGDIKIRENKIGFLECFSATDYYKLSGLTKDELFDIPGEDYTSFFFNMMDFLAKKNGKGIWVQKFSPLSLNQITKKENVYYITIKRNIVDNIRSTCGMYSKNKHHKKNLVREVFIYQYMLKKLNKLRSKDLININYEDLRTNKKQTLINICKFLNIEFTEDLLVDSYVKNSSFINITERQDILKKHEVYIIKLLNLFVSLLPLFIFSTMHKIFQIFKSPYKTTFIPGTFKDHNYK